MTTARRALFASLIAGGAVTAGSAPAAAATRPTHVRVADLRRGDLVVGTGGLSVRVSSVVRSGSRYVVRAKSPYNGKTYPLKPRVGTTFARSQRFVVLMRGVPDEAIPLTLSPAPPAVIDGGRP